MAMVGIRLVADFKLRDFYFTRMLKGTLILHITTIAAIIFIQCWVFVLYGSLLFHIFNSPLSIFKFENGPAILLAFERLVPK